MSIFDQRTNRPNDLWLRYRDAEAGHAKLIRDLLEKAWTMYEPYAERGFLQDLQGDSFYQRWWEMYLTCRLLELGVSVSHPGEGMPDICIEWRGQRILIECISPAAGMDENAIPDFPDGEAHHVPRDQVVLRLTSAIWSKVQQAQQRQKKGRISVRDRYFVAVDDNRLRSAGFDDDFYLNALYGVGRPQVHLDRLTLEVRRVTSQWLPQTQTAAGAVVNLAPFIESMGYNILSGVLFCNANIGNVAVHDYTPDLVLCHNFRAGQHVSRKLLRRKATQFFFDGYDSVVTH